MLGIFTKYNLVIDDNGQVACPRREFDVDAERCFQCVFLTGAHLDAVPPALTCRYPGPATPLALTALLGPLVRKM